MDPQGDGIENSCLPKHRVGCVLHPLGRRRTVHVCPLPPLLWMLTGHLRVKSRPTNQKEHPSGRRQPVQIGGPLCSKVSQIGFAPCQNTARRSTVC